MHLNIHQLIQDWLQCALVATLNNAHFQKGATQLINKSLNKTG